MPVLGSEVALVANSAAVDDDAKDNKANTSCNLDCRQDEFDCDRSAWVFEKAGSRFLPSPYPRTPKIWTMIRATRKTVTHTACRSVRSGVQGWRRWRRCQVDGVDAKEMADAK